MRSINSFLSDQCKALILGSLLGDGSLRVHNPYRNARFSFRHSVHQRDYFFWKSQQCQEISSDISTWQQSADGFGGKKLRYQSRALPNLTELYNLTHLRGRLKIRRKWLDQMTALSLAVWWLDDGSLIGIGGRRGVFCTDSFEFQDQQLLANYLSRVWGVRVAIGKIIRVRKGTSEQYYRLWIRSSEQLKKLLRIIMPHIKVKSMLPKVILLYRDSKLQQRWISEVSRLTGFSIKDVERQLYLKQLKWQRFRE